MFIFAVTEKYFSAGISSGNNEGRFVSGRKIAVYFRCKKSETHT